MRGLLLSTALIVVLTFAVARTYGQSDSPHLNPQKWTSDGGEWVLTMDPSDPGGRGPGEYRMTRAGKEIWSAKLGWSLRDARVASTGRVIGYAYDTGYMGWGGHLVAVVLDPGGAVLGEDKRERDGPALHMTPEPPGEPRGNGVILDEEGGRGIIRTSRNGGGEPSRWLIYSLADGTHMEDLIPTPPPAQQVFFSREVAAELVPRTDLILVHWYAYRGGSARFDLIDRGGEVIWSHDIPGEYANLGERWRWWDLFENGVRQIEVSNRAFAIVTYAGGQRIRYSVARAEDGAWKIAEEAREPGAPTSRTTSVVEWIPERIDLNKLGEIPLGPPTAPSPIDGICSLSIDGRGRVGWVRWNQDAGDEANLRFVLVAPDGTVVKDSVLDLKSEKGATLPTLSWIDGDRWVIGRTVSAEGGASSAECYFLDATTGGLSRIDVVLGSVERLRGTPDGGFVCLGRLHGEYTIRDQLARFDREGKVVSSETQPGYGHGDMFHDVCVLSDGSVAALTAVKNTVKVWRPGAKEPEVWPVGDIIAGGFIYLADMRADKDGGIVIHETSAGPVLYRIDKHQKIWQTLQVRGPKDEKFRLYDPFAIDPDGRIWASDGSRLFRLDETGKADLAFGGPAENGMGDPVALTLDKEGAIYVLEKSTARVHIFDPEGQPRRVLTPLPTDVPTQDALAWIAVDDDGTVRYRMTWEGPVMVFNADGSRRGPEPEPEDKWSRPPEFRSVPGGGGLWQQNGQVIRRLNADGSVAQEISRRRGGEWLFSILDAAGAPDGSLALICQEPREGMFRRASPRDGPWLCLYSRDGSAGPELKIPPTSWFIRLGFQRDRLLLSEQRSVTVVPVPFGPARRWEIPGESQWWHVYINPRNGEWLTWAHGARVLQRWEAPR